MKNYETGICAHCGKKKADHNEAGTCDDLFQDGNGNYVPQCFKDSGEAQLEKNAPKLLEALEFAREFHMLDDPDGEPFTSINKAINEALKRE